MSLIDFTSTKDIKKKREETREIREQILNKVSYELFMILLNLNSFLLA